MGGYPVFLGKSMRWPLHFNPSWFKTDKRNPPPPLCGECFEKPVATWLGSMACTEDALSMLEDGYNMKPCDTLYVQIEFTWVRSKNEDCRWELDGDGDPQPPSARIIVCSDKMDVGLNLDSSFETFLVKCGFHYIGERADLIIKYTTKLIKVSNIWCKEGDRPDWWKDKSNDTQVPLNLNPIRYPWEYGTPPWYGYYKTDDSGIELYDKTLCNLEPAEAPEDSEGDKNFPDSSTIHITCSWYLVWSEDRCTVEVVFGKRECEGVVSPPGDGDECTCTAWSRFGNLACVRTAFKQIFPKCSSLACDCEDDEHGCDDCPHGVWLKTVSYWYVGSMTTATATTTFFDECYNADRTISHVCPTRGPISMKPHPDRPSFLIVGSPSDTDPEFNYYNSNRTQCCESIGPSIYYEDTGTCTPLMPPVVMVDAPVVRYVYYEANWSFYCARTFYYWLFVHSNSFGGMPGPPYHGELGWCVHEKQCNYGFMHWHSEVQWVKQVVNQNVQKKLILGVDQVNGETIPVPMYEEEGSGEGYCMAYYSAPPLLMQVDPSTTPSGFSAGDWATLRTQNANFVPGWPSQAKTPDGMTEYHYCGCTGPTNNPPTEEMCPPDP